MTPLECIGTPAERWASAELDVLLGRVTARELWELGRATFGAIQKEADERVEEAKEEKRQTESDLRDAEDKIWELERELDNLKAGAKK